MRRTAVAVLLLMMASTVGAQQPPEPPEPDLGPVGDLADGLFGSAVPPVLRELYNLTGQNITREDVRISLDLNVTKGDVQLLGLLVGSGRMEVQARIDLRVEMRVISSERIRAVIQGEDAFNISADNATWYSQVFIPAEVFRTTLAAEVVRAFQDEQEAALKRYLEETVPELELLGLDYTWYNTLPTEVLREPSLTEPPIVLEIAATVQYIRTESLGSLLAEYLDRRAEPDDPQKAQVERLKEENGDPLRARDFFAAAAYTQLLNLSMQPGWSLDVSLAVPRGYSFTYFNDEVQVHSERQVSFAVDARDGDEEVHAVLLASLTHKRAVALVLFLSTLLVGFLAAFPVRFLYLRYRVPALADKATRARTAPDGPGTA